VNAPDGTGQAAALHDFGWNRSLGRFDRFRDASLSLRAQAYACGSVPSRLRATATGSPQKQTGRAQERHADSKMWFHDIPLAMQTSTLDFNSGLPSRIRQTETTETNP
jgi:hypothetical protein